MYNLDTILANAHYNDLLAEAQPRREMMRHHPLFLRPLGIRKAVENFIATIANTFTPRHKSLISR